MQRIGFKRVLAPTDLKISLFGVTNRSENTAIRFLQECQTPIRKSLTLPAVRVQFEKVTLFPAPHGD